MGIPGYMVNGLGFRVGGSVEGLGFYSIGHHCRGIGNLVCNMALYPRP